MSLANDACCQVEVSATGRSLVQRNPIECVCVCVSLNVIKRNNNPVHLQSVGRRGQTKKERRNKTNHFQPH
jgi:hypothetical protein